MTLLEAMQARHSVRRYLPKPLAADVVAQLQAEIDRCNLQGDLHIQLVLEHPEAFGSILHHYGLFHGVRNYLVFAGKPADDLDQRVGYYGEQLVLKAQQMGLNTCWVGGTYSKNKIHADIAADEKIVCVIPIGYGANQGRPHRNKKRESFYQTQYPLPDWFERGLDAAMLAPTAVNQQKFRFTYLGENKVRAEATTQMMGQLDLGIVKYHFELGAGTENFIWA